MTERCLIARGRVALLALAILLLGGLPPSSGASNPNQDIEVRVRKNGQNITVDVDCPVDAPRSVAWDVLTDYDHMAQFISNLEYSRIEGRVDDLLRVHQKGKASRGFLSLTFDNVRVIELVPYSEIRSQLVSGDMKSASFVTRIVQTGGRLHILNDGQYTPNLWVPPLIGPALIETETQKQFGEIRAEILRRSALRRANGASSESGLSSASRPADSTAAPVSTANEYRTAGRDTSP